jgi:hypothetical protein
VTNDGKVRGNKGTPREIIEHRLRVYAESGCNRKEAARRLRIDATTLRNTLDRAKNIGMDVPKKPEAPIEAPLPPLEPEQPVAPTILQRLRDKVKYLEAELREVHRDNISTEDVRQRILGLTESNPEPPSWLIEPTKSDFGYMTAPSTIWSDWHRGEVVSSAETNGINEFNTEVADARVQRLVRRLMSLCFEHAAHSEYPGLVLNIIGDIVSGGIHQELRETNDQTDMQTVLSTVDVLCWALKVLADRFGRLFVVFVPGNHGRNTVKPHAKRYVFQNFDWLIGCLIRRHFEMLKDARVTFLIPDSGEALYRVFGWRYMAVHGDDLGVKGGDGIIGSAGPIIRGDIKIRNSNSQIGRDYDFLMMGHWHQQFWFPKVIVNNTLKGFCEFSRRVLKAVPTTPSQSLWETHPDHGIINRRDIFVDRQVRRATVTPWSSPFEVQGEIDGWRP